MVNSRRKGALFELVVAKLFKGYGYNAYRTAQHCGKTGDAPDVAGVPHLHIECKSYKDIGWRYEWLEQAKRDCKEGKLPVVIHKTNGNPVLVTMQFDDWMQLYNDTTYPEEADE